MKGQQGRRPETGKAIVPALSVFAQFSSAQILACVFGHWSFDCTPGYPSLGKKGKGGRMRGRSYSGGNVELEDNRWRVAKGM